MGAPGVTKRHKCENEMVYKVETMYNAVVKFVESILVQKKAADTAQIHAPVEKSVRREPLETKQLTYEQNKTS